MTLDTLRADHLGSYGYPGGNSPFIDSLAERGIVFVNAFSPTSDTAPAHASLFTGLYPAQHRLLDNGHRLPSSLTTMAQVFRQETFQTFAVASTNRHFISAGMDRGFDQFNEPKPSEETPNYRRAALTVEKALAVLDEVDPERPFFFWLHLFDPHWPHQSDRDSLPRYGSEEADELLDFLRRSHQASPVPLGGEEEVLFDLIAGYDAEIRYLDRHLERFFEGVATRGLDDDSLWVVTSDHGESLSNHGHVGHSVSVYNELVRVPLIFFQDEPLTTPGKRVDTIVELIDIFPTLAELLKADEAMPRVEGNSFAHLILDTGEPGDPTDPYAFAQRSPYGGSSRHARRQKQHFGYEPSHLEGPLYAIQDVDYKYLYWEAGMRELYRVSTDPYEIYDLKDEDPLRVEQMHTLLMARLARYAESAHIAPESVDEETLEGLKALGYVE